MTHLLLKHQAGVDDIVNAAPVKITENVLTTYMMYGKDITKKTSATNAIAK